MIKGNQFWKLRSKHGRDKLFASPELMWEAAKEYFEWCDNNPWNTIEYKGAAVERVEVPTARPYTLTALCIYLQCSESYFRTFKHTLKDGDPEGFLPTINLIEQVIYNQKLEGAIVGAYNANIISRELGLMEKIDHTTGGEKINQPQLTQEHIDKLIDKL
jgi:hypothetical protein